MKDSSIAVSSPVPFSQHSHNWGGHSKALLHALPADLDCPIIIGTTRRTPFGTRWQTCAVTTAPPHRFLLPDNVWLCVLCKIEFLRCFSFFSFFFLSSRVPMNHIFWKHMVLFEHSAKISVFYFFWVRIVFVKMNIFFAVILKVSRRCATLQRVYIT